MSDYFVAKDGELFHFGVKGMKWGVRKKRDEGGIRSKTSNRDGVTYARSRQREEARKFRKEYAKNRIREGAIKASIVLGIVGGYYLWDKVTNDGDGAKAIKKTTVAMGRALVDGYINAMTKYGDD